MMSGVDALSACCNTPNGLLFSSNMGSVTNVLSACSIQSPHGLLFSSNANKLKLIVEGVQETLTKALIKHAHLDFVVIECISTVACLAEAGKE